MARPVTSAASCATRDTQFGEAFVGSGAEAAHINTVLGRKGGPVETSFTVALATPRQGHAAFVAVVRPGLPVKPLTLFVNKAELNGERHSRLTWGAAQAGVASGVLWAVADGVIGRRRGRPALDRRGVGGPPGPSWKHSCTRTTARPLAKRSIRGGFASLALIRLSPWPRPRRTRSSASSSDERPEDVTRVASESQTDPRSACTARNRCTKNPTTAITASAART